MDDTFLAAYGVAGTPEDSVEQILSLKESGVTQVTVTMLGDTPEVNIQQLGAALSGS